MEAGHFPSNHQAPNDTASHDDRRRKRLPKDYAEAVSALSTQAKEHSLHPGIHYRPLALFLSGNSYNGPNPHTIGPARRAHIFATIHDLGFEPEDSRRVTFFDSNTGLTGFGAHPLPRNDQGQLLFLRGYPSHDWLNIIGAKYYVDAEFFRRHMSFEQASDFYDVPAPVSSSQNIVKLSVTSIGKRSTANLPHQEGKWALDEHFSKLGKNPSVVGESLVRRFAVHDQERFSIQQDISLCVLKRGEGWIAIIFLDNGRDLDDGPGGPWLESPTELLGFDNIFHPVIQFQPNLCFKEKGKVREVSHSQRGQLAHKRRFLQSAALLHTESYGRFLNPVLMKTDAFYALSEIFAFAACAESQFLNLMRSKFEAETDRHNEEEHMQQSLLDLKRHKFMLHQRIEQLQSTIACIKQRGNPKWPRAKSIADSFLAVPATRNLKETKLSLTSQSTQQDIALQAGSDGKIESAIQRLLNDYEEILQRAKSLSQLYAEGMEDIRSYAMLAESRKQIDQARGVARLTLLAYFFIPLSFTTSLFGMNFRELGNHLSIWVWFAVSIPVFAMALVLCYWAKILPVLVRFRHEILPVSRN